jgi:CHAT domain-containing protein
MGRRRTTERLEAIATELEIFCIIYPPPQEQAQLLVKEMAELLEARNAWDAGRLAALPSVDIANQWLTLERLSVAANVADFVLRRTADGVRPSRPATVDTIRISDRLAGCLDVVRGAAGDWARVPAKLRRPAHALAWAQFELCRTLLGHLVLHPAPNMAVDRDSTDGWLDQEGRFEMRELMLQRVTTAYRAAANMPPLLRGATAEENLATMTGNFIIAHLQVASVLPGVTDAAAHVRQSDWMTTAEIAVARSTLESAVLNETHPSYSQYLLAHANLDLIEGKTDSTLSALRQAAQSVHVTGRDRIGLLQTLLARSQQNEDRVALITEVLDECDRAPAAVDVAAQRAGSMMQLLSEIGRVAIDSPGDAPPLLRRVAAIPTQFDFQRTHLWMVPGATCVAVLVDSDGSTEVTQLPGLSDDRLLARISDDHAEEFESVNSVDGLRKDLTSALEPLRSRLASRSDAVTMHAFAFLKHVPLAALTGRGSLLAQKPGVMILAPAPDPAECRESGTFWLVDEDFSQTPSLPVRQTDEVARYHSTNDPDDQRWRHAFSALSRTDRRRVVVFSHGHVDQFRVEHTGIVVQRADAGPLIVPALQIAQFDLRHVELAVILACGAGQGNVFVEPSLSLGHAFRFAGVHEVIAPTWPVEAAIAAAFLDRFLLHANAGVHSPDAWARVLAEDPNRFVSFDLFGA